MRILLTGGGTGGHFFPVIAVAEALRDLAREEKLAKLDLYFMAPEPYDKELLFENGITFIRNPAGKARRYFSILNIFDAFKTLYGIIKAVFQVFSIYPDVVFGKGGYASFPALFAARLLRIPVVIHESDTVPGRVNEWAGKFAKRVAVSYEEAASFFPNGKTAVTGNPLRKAILNPIKEGAAEFLKLEKNVPTILILGGSLGARIINDTVLEALPSLVERFQIIHQTGKDNFKEVRGAADAMLSESPNRSRYKPFDFINNLGIRMAAGAADIVVSRAGSTIFEIASWGLPSIIIPITDSNGDHQRKNAFAYARKGACSVIEEINLSPNLLVAEIVRIIENKEEREAMSEKAAAFGGRDAALAIAKELVSISLTHESKS